MIQSDAYHLHIAYTAVILRRFIEKFDPVTYQGVSLCRYLYSPFIAFLHQQWPLGWGLENLGYAQDEMDRLTESDFYALFDESYPYHPHPDGIIILPDSFVNTASSYISKERYCFVNERSKNERLRRIWPAENWLDIENYARDGDDAGTAESLTRQIADAVAAGKGDPVMGSPDLLEWFKNQIPLVIQQLNAANNLFETMNVSVIVTMFPLPQVSWVECALMNMAKARRIPSLTLQPHMFADSDLFGHIPLIATQKMVWGKSTLDWFQKYGYPESRVSVIGCTQFDKASTGPWWGREELCRRWGVDSSQKIIILTTQPLGIGESILPVVLSGLDSFPGIFLAVLLHPAEHGCLERYRELTAGFANCRVFRAGMLYDALSGAELLLTGCSMTAIEGMIFKLPVITVETFLEKFPHFSYQRDLGYSLFARDAGSVRQLVNRLISEVSFRENAIKTGQEFLDGYCLADGLASRRLFQSIDQFCRTGGVT